MGELSEPEELWKLAEDGIGVGGAERSAGVGMRVFKYRWGEYSHYIGALHRTQTQPR